MDSCLKNRNKRLRTTHNLDDFPDDCLHLIYEKLETKRDRDSFGRTCHNFLDIQSSSRKHLTPGFCSFINVHATDSFVLNMLNRFRNLETLSLTRCRGLSGSGLANLLLYGSKLQSLNLSYCSRVTDIGLSCVALGCPFLSDVNLNNCSSITDHGLQILVESCKSLKLVDLTECSRITDLGIRCLYQNCRQLTALSFQGVSHSLASIEDKLCSFDSTGVSDFVNGGALKYFSFSSYIREIGLGFCAKLKILDLKTCGDLVDDATILKIAKGCPLLQEWNLSYCYKIAFSGWDMIGLYCQNLKILHVHRCVKLGDKGLLAVGYGCDRLSVIYMTHCYQITPSGIFLLRKNRKDVEIIEEESTSL